MDVGHRANRAGEQVAELTAARIQVPRARAGSLERERLLGPLMSATDTSIVIVRAPAGSGKTTLLAHWASVDRAQDFAWISLDETDNDIVALWRHIVDALGSVATEAAAHAAQLINRPSPDVTGKVVPAILSGLAEWDPPVVLVLDDFQTITDQACHDSIRQFIRGLKLAYRCTLVVASRNEPTLNLAKLRIEGRALTFLEADLAFTPTEVAQLLARHGVRPADAVPQLLADTNGWATGVHLSIDRVVSTDPKRPPHDRRDLIHEFLVQEVLDPMDAADRDFLRRCSILTTLSPAICEHVAGTSQAGRRLATLSKGNVLITLVDPNSQTYRLHQLLRETLERDLHEADSDGPDRVHALAAQWFVEHDRPIEAVEHALRVSTTALAADIIARCWFDTIMTGNLTTVARWLGQFDDTKLREFPFLLIAAAWTAGFRGDWAAAWRYSRASRDLVARGEAPDGTASFQSSRALMLAGLGLDGVTEVRTQAEIAYRLEGPESRLRPLAAALLGAASLALGDNDAARSALGEAATAITGPAGVATYAMGQLAILEASERRWAEAERISHEAIEGIEELGLENLVSSGAAYVMHAAAAAHRGDLAIARRRLQALNPILPSLSTAMPFDALQIHLLAAETFAAIGDLRSAATHTEAARHHCELLDDAGKLEDRLTALSATIPSDATPIEVSREVPTLTARERDILTLLPTALSLREVGDHLYVSRDTVKTYVTRIYRKLGVASRSAAVTRATELGMVGTGTTGIFVQPSLERGRDASMPDPRR